MSVPERLNRIQIAADGDVVAVGWDEREELLGNLDRLHGLSDIADVIRDKGASQIIRLTDDQVDRLAELLDDLFRITDLTELPDLFELRNALFDEIAHRTPPA